MLLAGRGFAQKGFVRSGADVAIDVLLILSSNPRLQLTELNLLHAWTWVSLA
jgi:hypothetical protein